MFLYIGIGRWQSGIVIPFLMIFLVPLHGILSIVKMRTHCLCGIIGFYPDINLFVIIEQFYFFHLISPCVQNKEFQYKYLDKPTVGRYLDTEFSS